VVERKENDKSRQIMMRVMEDRFDFNVNIN
jgi:hypothetical protein